MSKDLDNISRPNHGRIYDYLLGGHHNFEVDRQAGDRLVSLFPFAPKAARLQRWCLGDIAEELTRRRGYKVIVDFASGLPTQDHLHQCAAPDTTVVYSDYDPVTVEYAHEILQGVPDVYTFLADVRHPEDLLERPEVLDILQGRRDIAFVMWGVASFLTDEDWQHIAHYLYDWSGPKSCMVFQAQFAGADPNAPAVSQANQVAAQTGIQYFARSLEQYQRLVQPWHPDLKGFISLLEWHGLDPAIMTAADVQSLGPGGAGYGAYLIK